MDQRSGEIVVNGFRARVMQFDPEADEPDPTGWYVARWDEVSQGWVINTEQRFPSREAAQQALTELAAIWELSAAGLVEETG